MKTMSNLTKRLITGAVLVCIIAPLIIWYNDTTDALYGALMCCACYGAGYEILNMLGKKYATCHKLRFILPFLSLIISALCAIWAKSCFASVKSIYLIIGLIISFLIIICVCVFVPHTNGEDFMGMLTALIYGGLFLGMAFSIRFIPERHIVLNHITLDFRGNQLLLLAFIITLCSDGGGYVAGRLWGCHKLCPLISPKKTVEGSIGGLIATAIVATLYIFLRHLITFNTQTNVGIIILVLLIVLILSILSMLGDLIASLLKRHYDIKDYSQLFPGHGGILDRFDSLIPVGMSILMLVLIFNFLV